jgi:hypothetical protein
MGEAQKKRQLHVSPDPNLESSQILCRISYLVANNLTLELNPDKIIPPTPKGRRIFAPRPKGDLEFNPDKIIPHTPKGRRFFAPHPNGDLEINPDKIN